MAKIDSNHGGGELIRVGHDIFPGRVDGQTPKQLRMKTRDTSSLTLRQIRKKRGLYEKTIKPAFRILDNDPNFDFSKINFKVIQDMIWCLEETRTEKDGNLNAKEAQLLVRLRAAEKQLTYREEKNEQPIQRLNLGNVRGVFRSLLA